MITRADESGFTLAELLVACAVSMVVLIAGWGFYLTQLRSLSDQSATLEATDKLRGAMTFLAREVRFAGYDPRAAALVAVGAKGVRDARGDRMTIEFDADASGGIDADATGPAAESVLYAYDSANRTVLRTVAGSTETLVSEVSPGGLLLEYLDADGAALPLAGTPAALSAADRDRVAFVRVTLSIEAVDTQRSTVLTQTMDVALRNRILDRL
ncbi:MAG: type pilus assembly protein PilW [Candidatus Binatota bacterium]|nr:type pilus assembly protein PilW [Candidatus Binatota bacterium]